MNKDILNTPFPKKDPYGILSMPVYQAAAFEFDSAEAMELAFTGKTAEHVYSRITNPTVEYFENRIKVMTGAYSVTALNSGMAAITNALITVAGAGKNIVTSKHLFGNTYSLLASSLKDFGVETRFCDLGDSDEVNALIDENTCAVFMEIITNPQLEVIDIEALADIAHKKNVPVIADTTIIPFGYFKAKEFGVDIEVVSSTKYISGGATSIGGLIVDYASFDWAQSGKLSALAAEQGNAAFTFKLRKEIHRNLGSYMSPQTAYMQTLGLETLSLRYERACNSCQYLAEELQKTEGIESVNYVGLADNPFHAVSVKQFGSKFGAMMTFDMKDKSACFEFMNRLKVIRRATNLFDNNTLAIHPASTIYGNFSASVKEEMHVTDKTIRLSVGLEEPEALLEDIKQALV